MLLRPQPHGLCTVLSAGFLIFVYWKFAVHRQHNLHPCTGFLFPVNCRIYISVYILCLFLPANGPPISGGLFCALEYCSIFAIIRMYTADTVDILQSIYRKNGAGKKPFHLPFALLPYGLFAGITR